MSNESEQASYSSKRRRLNHACDRCRGRKTRCDDRYPDCSNCLKAGTKCLTRDPRNPRASVVRHEAQSQVTIGSVDEDVGFPVYEDTPASVINYTSSVHRTVSAKEVEDTIQPPGQGRATAKLPAFPRFMNGNSLYILTQWLDLAFARLNHSSRFSHLYKETNTRPATVHVKEEDIDKLLESSEQREAILASFLGTVHRVFQVQTEDYWRAILTDNVSAGPVRSILRALLLALSEVDSPQQYLDFAFSRISVIIQHSSIDGLLALLLMVIAFRGYHDSHTTLHLLTFSNSITHALTLHDASAGTESHGSVVWWSLYIIDKALAIELERKPIVTILGCNLKEPQGNDFLAAAVGLAKIQESIINRMFEEREMEDSRDRTLNEIITQKMRSAGELDELLLQWNSNLPQHLRVSDHLCTDDDGFPGSVFLSLQFHQTMFAIHRNSLITNASHIRMLADKSFPDQKYRLRLRNGSLICYSTAKSIIMLTCQIYDHGMQSTLDITHTLLIAVTGLAIYIYKHPNTSTVHIDLQLLSTAIDSIERRAVRNNEANQDHDLGRLLRALHVDLVTRVHKYAKGETIRSSAQPSHPQELRNVLPDNSGFPSDERELPTDPGVQGRIDYTDPLNFDISFFSEDAEHWPDFLELLDLSSPPATYSKHQG